MTLDELRKRAMGFFQKGSFINAISFQEKICRDPKRTYNDLKTLALFVITPGDFKKGLSVLQRLEAAYPDHKDAEIPETVALCLMRCKQYEEAANAFETAARLDPQKANTRDGLAEVYNLLGQNNLSIRHGTESLRLKNAASTHPVLRDLANVPVPPFQKTDRRKNILSYSLWGTSELYLKGALFNVQFAKKIYPEWTCRFYLDDTVPQQIQQQLLANGAELVHMARTPHPFEGLFWRFKVCNDDTVDRYLIRDADSVPCGRERMAVNDWIISQKHFHAMRDFATHTDLILAGMWGGVKGALPDLAPLIANFIKRTSPNKTNDQQFLRQIIWPTFKTSCLIHDSQHRLDNTVDFPAGSDLPAGKHVAQRFDAFLRPAGK